MVCLLLPVLLAAAATGHAQGTVDYLVRVEDPGSQLYHVETVLPATGAATLVSLPSWTPGAYHIENYARYVRDFSASDGDGTPLRWEKVDKDTWRVHCDGARRVRVSFNFYADDPTTERTCSSTRRSGTTTPPVSGSSFPRAGAWPPS
jgi:predicted metalloprotease with PDZ domain